MAKLEFDKSGEKYFSTGVSDVILSVFNSSYGTPVAWNGVTSISNSPEGGEANELYADNTKYLDLMSAEKLGGTIEAYQAPKEFNECDGKANGKHSGTAIPGMVIGAQTRKQFGIAYLTQKGNDVYGSDYGQVLHIIYGCKASPSEASYETINDSPDAITFSWSFTCTPISVDSVGDLKVAKPIYAIEVDSTLATEHWDDLIEYIYGTDGTPGTAPHFPTPEQVYDLVTTGSV